MKYLVYLALFFVGTIFGSFFYTLSHRYRNKKYINNFAKIFYEPSNCPKCGQKINPLFLFPVLGYLFTLGKCRYCKQKISFSYPLHEIVFGLLAIAVYMKYGLMLEMFIIYLILAIALTIAIIDFHSMIIPDSLNLAFFLLALYPFFKHANYSDNLYGMLLMGVVFLTIMLLFPGGFGGGDFKFAMCIGFLLGVSFSIVVLETALITGSIIGVLYGLVTKKGLRTQIAFGPFLTLGLFAAIFFGRDIVLLYSSLFL
jgi:prepilin signal peptidase PulO-like enzyme (type II secretory pathway)